MEEHSQPTRTNLPPTNNVSSSKHRWPLMVFVIAGIATLVIVAIVFLLNLGSETPGHQEPSKKLTVGDKTYLYPCAVTTREDYAKSFGLDDEKVGTVSELSALPLNDLKQDGDLSSLAPGASSKPMYSTQCSYTLAKKAARQVSRIEVEIAQFATDSEAKDEFERSARRAAGRSLFSEDTPQLPALPSFTKENSFVKTSQDNTEQQAGFILGSRYVEVTYQLTDTDTPDLVTPQLDAYSKAIKAKINSGAKTNAIDLTGHDTKVGAKLVDICRRTGLAKVAETLGGIEFRPDETTDISIYGSLDGSRAAADGAESYCTFGFNTQEDRQALAAVEQQEQSRTEESGFDTPITANARWPHTLNVSTNTYNSADEAKAAFATKKESAKQPLAEGAIPSVTEVSGIGEGAFKISRQSDLTFGSENSRILIDDAVVVISGKNIITVELQQLQEKNEYQTVPLKPTDDQMKKVYQLIADALTRNRR